MRCCHQALGLVTLAASLVACSGGSVREVDVAPPPESSSSSPTTDTGAVSTVAADITVVVDQHRELGTISPLIRGLSGDADTSYLRDVGATVNSWGGNPSSRFNYDIGHAWNAGADFEFRNTNYGHAGDEAVRFITETAAADASVRLAVPTLGWIPKNDDQNTCSFPTADGGCTAGAGVTCENPSVRPDPALANERSDPARVQAWVRRLVEQDLDIDFIAMDNEPELWGFTHYDVHPGCTTYEEVLDTYLTYATAIRAAAPDAELMGPVMCCWFPYWNMAPGTAAGDDVDFLTWFLQRVRDHDQGEGGGQRTLDVVDVHYYPQGDVYNDEVDPDTAARRLRSTRSLWDPTYVDESWINDRIGFIPRLRDTIAAAYPDTPIGITEWNFGADGSMNGALAIADVLGIYGREGISMASYWRSPKPSSPGYFAFKLHGNYDDQGSSFSGTAVAADTSDLARVGSYAAIDPQDGHLKIVLINKDPDRDLTTRVDLGDWRAGPVGAQYRYSGADPTVIVNESIEVSSDVVLELPRYSITLLDLAPAGS